MQLEREDIGRLQDALNAVRNTCLVDHIPVGTDIDVPAAERILLMANNLRAPVGNWHPFDNVWEIARLKKDELRISRVLAWYLDPKAGHGLGAGFIERFLSLSEIHASFSSVRVLCENYPDGLTGNRVDILIDSPHFLLIVEVKIGAGEQPDQIDRYCRIAASRAGVGRPWKVVYLTLDGRNPASGSSDADQVFCMSWLDVACILRGAAEHSSDISHFLANNFADHIENIVRG
ncbi:PD-(D/E)XK nuclease family protein [Thalassospira xiamenensis]|uniref:PDDEXK-like family protein n=1 Tax=Thalassospira xiamenensis TaxID=220697 RepID=UPI000AA568A9|nr:PD-(D/E)XK nuclease family protein [Thalassospira xiamenensis]